MFIINQGAELRLTKKNNKPLILLFGKSVEISFQNFNINYLFVLLLYTFYADMFKNCLAEWILTKNFLV